MLGPTLVPVHTDRHTDRQTQTRTPDTYTHRYRHTLTHTHSTNHLRSDTVLISDFVISLQVSVKVASSEMTACPREQSRGRVPAGAAVTGRRSRGEAGSPCCLDHTGVGACAGGPRPPSPRPACTAPISPGQLLAACQPCWARGTRPFHHQLQPGDAQRTHLSLPRATQHLRT